MSLITQLNDVMARRGYTQTHVARAAYYREGDR